MRQRRKPRKVGSPIGFENPIAARMPIDGHADGVQASQMNFHHPRAANRELCFSPNRIIGDASLPPEQRRTRTNVRRLKASTPLMESGLLGPVRLLQRQMVEPDLNHVGSGR